jgi:tetratricopeptide (TPR) repeat protein
MWKLYINISRYDRGFMKSVVSALAHHLPYAGIWHQRESFGKGRGHPQAESLRAGWLTGLLTLSVVSLSAQGGFPVSGGAQPSVTPQPAQAGMSAPTSGIFESNSFLEMANRVFDPSSDSMDFENGSFEWKGKNFNLTEQRAFRSRFERFLLTSPTEEEAQYAQLMEDILQRLSVSNNNSDDAILDTWELLFRATRFELDGGNSTIIANQVFNAWRIRKESRGVTMTQRELQEIRRYQQEVIANRALALKSIQEKRQRESSVARNNSGSAGATGNGEVEAVTSEAAFRMLDLAETEAKIIALETQAVATGLQAKLQFQSQIVSFILQRRFQHALILAGFYQSIFKGSHQALEVGKDQLQEFVPGSDLAFTVDSMTFIAREAVNDVNKGVSAVNAAYEEGRNLIALERLQEVFFLGEYLTELNKIPTDQRRRMLELYRGLIEAGELADAKDYDGVAELATEISKLAEDFPKNRVLSAVETAKSMSDMAVFAASQYRNLGDIDKARAELQTAINIWPGNPSIREFQQETTKLATAGSQGLQIFDDLYKRGDRRGIYDRRMDLGFALAEDTERRPLLMEVIEQVARIDLLVAQSTELVKQDEPYAAWELLVEAAGIDPSDGPMNRARAELAPRVADFVLQLDLAKRQSEEGHHAGALAAYLAAQDIYPASRICRVGIARESEALMSGLRRAQAAP